MCCLPERDRRPTDDLDGPIGDVAGAVQLVGGEQHRRADRGRFADQPVDHVTTAGIEPGVRFVEQPQLGATRDHRGERDAAALPGRQRVHGQVVQPCRDLEAVQCEATVGHRRTGGPRPEVHVVDHGQVLVQEGRMAEQTDPTPHRGPVAEEIHTEDVRLARADLDEPGTHPKQRRLARAVRTTKQHDLARIHVEVDAGERREPPEEGDGGTEVDGWLQGRNSRRDGPTLPVAPSRRPSSGTVWGVLAKVLGGIGRVFILAGLFILGFVAFQLWGTGLEEGRNQSALSDQLTESAPVGSKIADAGDPADVASALAKVDTATAPVTEAPAEGEPVGIIEIPRIELARVIVQGVDKPDLKKGPGHYPGTPLPGQAGNSGIAGHRTTYGAPFNRIDELRPGDDIIISTPQGRFVYKVIPAPGTDAAWFTVSPKDTSVLDDKGDNRITLTACHPKYSAKQRIIVSAVLQAPPAPTSPPSPSVTEAAARSSKDSLDDSMAGDSSALMPALLFVGGAIAVGILAWFVGRHWRKVPTWLIATPAILALVWFSYVFLDRYLPSI